VEELHGDPTAGHAPRSGPEVKNGRSSAKGDAPKRLGYGTVKEEVPISCTNISPPQRGGAVPAPSIREVGRPKWRDNYPEGPDHPVAPQSSGIIVSKVVAVKICTFKVYDFKMDAFN